MRREAVRDLLRRLDPPDCSCEPDVEEGQTLLEAWSEFRCPHLLSLPDPVDLLRLHEVYMRLFGRPGRSFPAELAAVAAWAWPGQYEDRPRPSRAVRADVSREARIREMERRAARGQALFREDDPWRPADTGLGVQARRLRNGAMVEGGVCRA